MATQLLVGGPVYVFTLEVRRYAQHVAARLCCISGGLFFTVTENVFVAQIRENGVPGRDSAKHVHSMWVLFERGHATRGFSLVQTHCDPETVSACNAIAMVVQMLGGVVDVTMHAYKRTLYPLPRHLLTQNTILSAGVVFEGQLRHNLAVYAPNVDLGPISVTAIHSMVSSTARPTVVRAYIKSVRAPTSQGSGVNRSVPSAPGLCFLYGGSRWLSDNRGGCTNAVSV